MSQRQLGSFNCAPIGLGCMNLSHAYGTPPSSKEAQTLLLKALDLGYDMFDTAALYGFGNNETLLGNTLKTQRDKFLLASKCGIFKNDAGVREINGSPAVIRKTCEDSLKRLQTDVIDLYYLHRWDRSVPIEESVAALADLVKEGKIRDIGLSEVSADTLRKAHAVHPIAAVQTEYSLWSRNAEIAVLDACRELGTSFVAFSPVARGFLSGELRDINTLAEKDLRRNMPRFNSDNYPQNLLLLDKIAPLADRENCTIAQLSLAWVLSRGEHVVAIPGTTNLSHLEDNFKAGSIALAAETIEQLDAIMNQDTVVGPRYNAGTQKEIDTEEF